MPRFISTNTSVHIKALQPVVLRRRVQGEDKSHLGTFPVVVICYCFSLYKVVCLAFLSEQTLYVIYYPNL